jgi:hypothetical protein
MIVMDVERPRTPPDPVPDLDRLARALVTAGDADGVSLRMVGGIAVRFLCPSAVHGPLARTCKDIDLVARSKQRPEIDAVLTGLGYLPDEEFNLYQGAIRLNYAHPETRVSVDIFLDRLAMCHCLELADRLALQPLTLDPADLLLSKLQIVQTNERDLQDATALLSDTTIDHDRIAGVLAADWGWWRTSTEVLDRVAAYAGELDARDVGGRAVAAAARLREAIDEHPKSRKWRLRARVGDRVAWYELPEEVEG